MRSTDDDLDSHSVTRLLEEVRSLGPGSEAAKNRLFGAVYDELRTMARRLVRDERASLTLQPTDLVHEAFVRLAESSVSWESRAHFFGIAARAMRQVLVDHARARNAEKRGGGRTRITLSEATSIEPPPSWEILALHEALEKLARENERVARGAELRIFAGLTGAEAAHVLGVSARTVAGDWTIARLWLTRELGREQP